MANAPASAIRTAAARVSFSCARASSLCCSAAVPGGGSDETATAGGEVTDTRRAVVGGPLPRAGGGGGGVAARGSEDNHEVSEASLWPNLRSISLVRSYGTESRMRRSMSCTYTSPRSRTSCSTTGSDGAGEKVREGLPGDAAAEVVLAARESVAFFCCRFLS